MEWMNDKWYECFLLVQLQHWQSTTNGINSGYCGGHDMSVVSATNGRKISLNITIYTWANYNKTTFLSHQHSYNGTKRTNDTQLHCYKVISFHWLSLWKVLGGWHHLATEAGCGTPWHSASGSCRHTAGHHWSGECLKDEQSSQASREYREPHRQW